MDNLIDFYSKLNGKQIEEYAVKMGILAFENGINAPALDKNLVIMLKGKKVGDKMTLRAMRAWQKGWTIANLRNPMEKEQC